MSCGIVAFRLAISSIRGEKSIPTTRPSGPTHRAIIVAIVPVPHATSNTWSPGRRPTSATTCSRRRRSLPPIRKARKRTSAS